MSNFGFYTDRMLKLFANALRILGILFGAVLLLVSGFLLFLTITEFSPPVKSTLYKHY